MSGAAFQLTAHVVSTPIDDWNYRSVVGDPVLGGEQMSRGRIPRDYLKQPYGSVGSKFEDTIETIPRTEWAALAEQQEKENASTVHLVRKLGIKPKNQNGTNYCWANGPTTDIQLRRVKRGHGFVSLSPASVAAIVKRGQNEGGWGSQAVELMADRGINTTETWPDNARNYHELDTPEAREEAKRYRVLEFVEVRPRNLDQLATLLLLGFTVAVGFNWWSHEVCAIRLRYFGGPIGNDNSWGTDIFNSWGTSYGDGGIGTLRGGKCLPDDAVCIYQMVPFDAIAA